MGKDAIREKEGPRGRKIKSKAANLGERFTLYKEASSGLFGMRTFHLTTIRRYT